MCRAVLLSLRQLLCRQQAALPKLHSPCRFVASVLRVMVWASFSREIKRSVQVLIRDSQALQYALLQCALYVLLASYIYFLLPLPLGLTMTALFTESVQFSIRVQSGLNFAEFMNYKQGQRSIKTYRHLCCLIGLNVKIRKTLIFQVKISRIIIFIF